MNQFRIIIVEDNLYWQDILKEDTGKALENFSCLESLVSCFATFEDAYKELKENEWSLLVTDIGIGGLDESRQKKGMRLVKLALQRKIPAIVVSGTPHLTTKNVRDLLINYQASDFFSKEDFQSELFIKKVHEVLSGKLANINHVPKFVDFAIITAITVEREAVCKAFGLNNNCRIKKESRVYWKGRFNLNDGKFYEIVVAQAIDMANVDAALLTNDTIRDWNPGSILMVGIAAAASEEENLGDLIVASHIYYYERGKEVRARRVPEPYMLPSDSTLLGRVISLPKWKGISIKKPNGSKVCPKISIGVIASGEKVIADAVVRNEIKSGQRKIRALEMEGYGFSKAAWQSYTHVRHLVIRAICDSADLKKDDKWHSYAASVAAQFTKFFLKDIPIAPSNQLKSKSL